MNRKEALKYINRNGKLWYQQRQTRKLVDIVINLWFGEL